MPRILICLGILMINKEGKKWVVRTTHGRVLGEHPTKKEALAQLQAVEASKRRRGKK
jgi:hypothetical protein